MEITIDRFNFRQVAEIFRTPVGRILTAGIGLSLIIVLLMHAGFHIILQVLSHAAPFFPWILLLEGGMMTCSMFALRVLYDKDRNQIPWGAFLSTALMGYSVMGLVPAGRAVAEATRATLLSRYSTPARAAAAATRMQAVVLLGNAMISIPATLALFWAVGFSLPAFLIFGNFVLTVILGTGILMAGRYSRVGTRLGKWISSFEKFGQEFDQHFTGKKGGILQGHILGALKWECLGRLLQVIQNGIMVVAVGGAFGIGNAFCSEALHLVGTATGDLIPAQLGATELGFRLFAGALGLHAADALSIALLAHLAQLFWVGVGLFIAMI